MKTVNLKTEDEDGLGPCMADLWGFVRLVLLAYAKF